MRKTGLIGLVLAVGLVVGFAANAVSGDGAAAQAAPGRSAPTPARTITVTSTASVGTSPDEAVIDFGLRSEADDGPTAYADNGARSDALISALHDAGVGRDDIETENVNLDRDVKDHGTPQERIVYVATTQLSVTVNELDSVTDVISAAVNAGVDSVRGLRFQVGDQTGARQDALSAAVRGARRKADAIASAAGSSVSGVVQVREEHSSSRPYAYRNALLASDFAGAAPAPLIVAPQTLSTQVTVTVIWAIA